MKYMRTSQLPYFKFNRNSSFPLVPAPFFDNHTTKCVCMEIRLVTLQRACWPFGLARMSLRGQLHVTPTEGQESLGVLLPCTSPMARLQVQTLLGTPRVPTIASGRRPKVDRPKPINPQALGLPSHVKRQRLQSSGTGLTCKHLAQNLLLLWMTTDRLHENSTNVAVGIKPVGSVRHSDVPSGQRNPLAPLLVNSRDVNFILAADAR